MSLWHGYRTLLKKRKVLRCIIAIAGSPHGTPKYLDNKSLEMIYDIIPKNSLVTSRPTPESEANSMCLKILPLSNHLDAVPSCLRPLTYTKGESLSSSRR